MSKLFVTLGLCLMTLFQYSEATCGVCNVNNGAACISKTEFHMCYDGRPNTDVTFKCQVQDEICTKFSRICIDTTEMEGALPACNDITKCGVCANVADGGFSCTSRTTFTMCMGNELTQTRGTCPPFKMCDITLGAQGRIPCVPECLENTISYCDLNNPIDVPEEPTTTTTTTETATTTTTTTETPTTTTTTTETPTTTTSTTETPTTTTTTTETPTTTTTTTERPTTTTTTTETPTTTTTTTERPTTTTTTTETPTTTTSTTETPTTTTSTTETPTTTTTTTVAPTTTTTTTEASTTSTTTTTTPTTTTTTEAPTTSTTTETTTTTFAPTPTQDPAVALCSQQTAVGRYPYPNDTVCRSYVYCYLKGNVMQATPMTCPGQLYFSQTTRVCGTAKPAGCI